MVGSPYYIAPEIFTKDYDYRCDLWSVGVLLYFMLSHTFPFKGQSSKEIFRSIKKDNLCFNGLVWEGVSENAKDFISKLLVKSPDIRLSAVEALSHPFLLKSMIQKSKLQARDYERRTFLQSEVSFEPLKRLTTVHCARIC